MVPPLRSKMAGPEPNPSPSNSMASWAEDLPRRQEETSNSMYSI